MWRNVRMGLTVLAIVGLAGSAMAHNLYPPTWAGGPLSYEAHWDFTTQPDFTGIAPDSESSTPGTGNEFLHDGFDTHIDISGEWSWDQDTSILPGADGSGLGVNVINWVDDEPEKWVWVQIYYAGERPSIVEVIGQEQADTSNEYSVPGQPLARHIDDGQVLVEEWMMQPNPDWEQIVIDVPVGTSIDQIDVHSISLPEPAGIMLLGIGGMAMMLRRRGA